MNVLIVFAHPEPHSFNGALRDVAQDCMQALGHSVEVSDLYAMRFFPAITEADFVCERADPARLNVGVEQQHAHERRAFAPEIQLEQQKVLRADLVILQFPMWWFGMPSILKGWIDRVFARGFAYLRGRMYDTGMLKGRRAMLSLTTGNPGSLFAPDGVNGDIDHILWPIHNGIFRYAGFEVLPAHIAYAPAMASPAERAATLKAYRSHLQTLDQRTPLYFHPDSDFGPDRRLKPGVLARSGFQRNVPG